MYVAKDLQGFNLYFVAISTIHISPACDKYNVRHVRRSLLFIPRPFLVHSCLFIANLHLLRYDRNYHQDLKLFSKATLSFSE